VLVTLCSLALGWRSRVLAERDPNRFWYLMGRNPPALALRGQKPVRTFTAAEVRADLCCWFLDRRTGPLYHFAELANDDFPGE
jgi:hypothetical protein